MHAHHENDLTPSLKSRRPAASAWRRRAQRLGAPTAGIVAVVATALIGSGLASTSLSADDTAGTDRTDVVTLAAGTGTLNASRTVAAVATPVARTKTVTVASAKASKKKARILAVKKYKAKVKRMAKKRPRAAAKKMMRARGYSARQQSCVIKLWNKESNWRWWADNPSSSAYGIPQALPGRKMASAGADWRTNPVTQIKWGLKYIKQRHGSPCGAWNHSKARGWY